MVLNNKTMGVFSNIFHRDLVIGNTNPNDGKPMNGVVAQINGKWKDEYVDILVKKNVKHLFISTSLGWTCDNYDFLTQLKSLETLDIFDGRDISIKQIESLKDLRTIELCVLNYDDIDFSLFKHLESFYCDAEKELSSIFQCVTLKKLYLDEFKMGDKHQMSKLRNLENLTIGNSNISNIEFVRNLPLLKKFVILNNKKITDFSPISSLKSLNWLELRGVKNIHTINFLEYLTDINVLLLECAAIDSIRPITNHQNLKALSLAGSNFSINDGDLTPIASLNNLSMLFISNDKTYNFRVNNEWNWNNYGNPKHDWITRCCKHPEART